MRGSEAPVVFLLLSYKIPTVLKLLLGTDELFYKVEFFLAAPVATIVLLCSCCMGLAGLGD